jgi:Spy/CpxP family protein refolding chaperone
MIATAKETDMSDINDSRPPLEPGAESSQQATQKGGGFRNWRRSALIVGVLVGGVALGAGGLAVAATMQGYPGWHHGPRLDFVQQFVRGQLDSVGATTAQETKVHDIIAAAFSDMAQNPGQLETLRKQALDLLRAPTVDRAAAEKLRADQIAALDAHSKKMVGALLDAADQLTPEQRAKLVERVEAMAQHGPWGGPHGRPMGGPGTFPMNGGHGPDAMPNHGPDGRADKD